MKKAVLFCSIIFMCGCLVGCSSDKQKDNNSTNDDINSNLEDKKDDIIIEKQTVDYFDSKFNTMLVAIEETGTIYSKSKINVDDSDEFVFNAIMSYLMRKEQLTAGTIITNEKFQSTAQEYFNIKDFVYKNEYVDTKNGVEVLPTGFTGLTAKAKVTDVAYNDDIVTMNAEIGFYDRDELDNTISLELTLKYENEQYFIKTIALKQ